MSDGGGLAALTILFAHARSGSENLAMALSRSGKLNLVSEPFNVNYPRWAPENRDYRSKVVNVETLYEQLAEVSKAFSGFKTIEWNLPRDLNDALISDENFRLVLLRRKNLLEAVTSHWIALQNNVWHTWDSRRVRPEDLVLPPAPIEAMRQTLDQLTEDFEHYEEVLSRRRAGVSHVICWEHLYTGSLASRKATFVELCNRLEIDDLAYEDVSDLVGPDVKRLNGRQAYLRIPNIEDVENVLGNDRTGWLLR